MERQTVEDDRAEQIQKRIACQYSRIYRADEHHIAEVACRSPLQVPLGTKTKSFV